MSRVLKVEVRRKVMSGGGLMKVEHLLIFCLLAVVHTAKGSTLLAFPTGAVTMTDSNVQLVSCVTPDCSLGPTVIADQFQAGTTSSAALSNSLGSGQASVNLATGQFKAAISGNNATSTAEGFEFINFGIPGSGTATISYSLSLNGTLSNFDPNGTAEADIGVSLFDVTGITGTFLTPLPSGGAVVSDGIPFVDGLDFDSLVVGPSLGPICTNTDPTFICREQFSDNGAQFVVNDSVSGSFVVSGNRNYLIVVGLSTRLDDDASFTGLAGSADFSHTGTLTFTDLDGATVNSLSGAFLTQSPTPEPSVGWMIGLGLGAFTLFRGRPWARRT
jgi:hypothetical protein